MKTNLVYGIVPDSKTRVHCIFCGVYIPKATKCIEEHANGSKHKENLQLMTEHGLKFSNNEVHCKPCKCTLGNEESVLKHIEGDDHANWMAAIEDLIDNEFIDLTSYLTTDEEEIKCEACNQKLQCLLDVIEGHVNSFDHRSNICEKLKPLNGIFSIEINDQLWCKVCNMYIENTVMEVLSHIDDEESHIEWFLEVEDLVEDHELSLEKFLSNKDEKYVFCNKCQLNVIGNRQSIEDHVNSDEHLSHFS